MWERTLQDLVRGLRANKNDETQFILKAIDEIRQEVRSKDMELKAGAILKMTFLDMLGYDLKWASFHIIETMSSPKFHLKTVGYLAASQSFNQDTDVIMLTTNLLKKDLSSNPSDVALALNGLSHFVTPDLARDLTQELNAMLNHSRSHIRKRTILTLFGVIQQYPDALPYCFPRLREKLEDPDPSVVTATVNLFCELSRRSPEYFLPLAPQLFNILTTSSNNWVLIKVIKLFGVIAPFEPRLIKKLQGPITDLIQTTPAISLLYECVHTCIIGGMLDGFNGLVLAQLCVTKLSAFLENTDQNLKYIALMAMVKIVPIRPELVAEHQAVILASLDDFDISIRMRALELISSMVTPKNCPFLVQQLLNYLAKANSPSGDLPSVVTSLSQAASGSEEQTANTETPVVFENAYRLEIATRILDMCSRESYENIEDFEWYLSVLLDLTYVARVDIGPRLRDQFVSVTATVASTRKYAVSLMFRLLEDDAFLLNAQEPGSCSEVLWAAAWICGEYSSECNDPQKVLSRLCVPSIRQLDPEIVIIYLQSIIKVYGSWSLELASDWDDRWLSALKKTVNSILDGILPFTSSTDVEVQERATNVTQIFKFINADIQAFQPILVPQISEYENGFDEPAQTTTEPAFPKSLLLLQHLYSSYELVPVSDDAQSRISPPRDLDLSKWIGPAPKVAVHSSKGGDKTVKKKAKIKGKGKATKGDILAENNSVEESSRIDTAGERGGEKASQRLARIQHDPYYLTDNKPKYTSAPNISNEDLDDIPIVRLDEIPVSTLDPYTSIAKPSSSRSSPASLEVAPSPSIEPELALSGVETPQPIVVKSKKKVTAKRKTPKIT